MSKSSATVPTRSASAWSTSRPTRRTVGCRSPTSVRTATRWCR
jgi:hypothetical protein